MCHRGTERHEDLHRRQRRHGDRSAEREKIGQRNARFERRHQICRTCATDRGSTMSVSKWNAQTRTRTPGFKLSGVAPHRTEETPQNQSLEENTLYPSSEQCARSSAATWVREASKSETRVGSCSVSNVAFSRTARCPVTSLEESMSSTPSSLEQAQETTFHTLSSSILSSQRRMRCTAPRTASFSTVEQIISGKEDGGSNFARGHYTI